jgi:hypothetical protein
MNDAHKKALKAKILAARAARRDLPAALAAKEAAPKTLTGGLTGSLTSITASLVTVVPHIIIKTVESISDDTLIGSRNAEAYSEAVVDEVADQALKAKILAAAACNAAVSRMAINKAKLDLVLNMDDTTAEVLTEIAAVEQPLAQPLAQPVELQLQPLPVAPKKLSAKQIRRAANKAKRNS